MSHRLRVAVLLAALLPASFALAQSPQEEWARHGFKHGAWDCDGACPAGRGARPHPTAARKRMTLACQHNIGDGRTLVSDGRLLPTGARFKVVTYRPERREDDWSYGTCVVDVTR